MIFESVDVKSAGGWVTAAALAVVRIFTKVDEGRLYSAMERMEKKVDTNSDKLDDVCERLVRLETLAERK